MPKQANQATKTEPTTTIGSSQTNFEAIKSKLKPSEEKSEPEKMVSGLVEEITPKRRRRSKKSNEMSLPITNMALYLVTIPDGLAKTYVEGYHPLEKGEIENLKNAWIDVLNEKMQPEQFTPTNVLIMTYALTYMSRTPALVKFAKNKLSKKS